MKKLSLLLFATFTTIIFNSCSKEETKVDELVTSEFTVYKNQTGDFSADALQAQNIDSKGVLNFYGAFDSENNPREIRTLTYQKANNDTIVNLIIDPLTNRLASSYFSVKGVKSPIIMKLDYVDNSKNINVSFYNYNWSTETSNLIYASQIENNNGVLTENPFYASKKIAFPTFLEGALALGTGLATAEIIGILGGGFTLSSGAATIIAGVLATQIVTFAAIGVAVFVISNTAGAATLVYIPSSSLPPSKTPIINPVSASSNPTPKLQTSSCVNTSMTFRASMDFEGSILISEVAGGQSPYTYTTGSDFQQSQVFSNKYKDGSYVVGIKDANGCVSVKLVSLKRENDCALSMLSITISEPIINKNWAAVTAQATGGDGDFNYKWSDEQNGRFATFSKSGIYTVKVTDGNGCSKSASITLNLEQVPNLLSGTTWKQIGYIHCGLDGFTIPEGEKALSAVCSTYINGYENCNKDNLTIFIDNYEGYIDTRVKCAYLQADKNYFKYTYDVIDNIVEDSTGAKYRIELNGSTMLWVYGDADKGWGYKLIFQKQ